MRHLCERETYDLCIIDWGCTSEKCVDLWPGWCWKSIRDKLKTWKQIYARPKLFHPSKYPSIISVQFQTIQRRSLAKQTLINRSGFPFTIIVNHTGSDRPYDPNRSYVFFRLPCSKHIDLFHSFYFPPAMTNLLQNGRPFLCYRASLSTSTPAPVNDECGYRNASRNDRSLTQSANHRSGDANSALGIHLFAQSRRRSGEAYGRLCKLDDLKYKPTAR